MYYQQDEMQRCISLSITYSVATRVHSHNFFTPIRINLEFILRMSALLVSPSLLDILCLVAARQLAHPRINLLLDNTRNSAFVHRGSILRLERGTVLVARRVESALKCVALPAEEVIAMIRVARAVKKC